MIPVLRKVAKLNIKYKKNGGCFEVTKNNIA